MKSKSSSRVAMVVAGVVLLAVSGLVYNSHRTKTVQISAMFADAYPMVAGSTVKIAGVQVGSVDKVVPDNGQARIIMDLDTEAMPLHTDARATIVTQDLLGERFIKLERGTPNAPVLPDGGTLSKTQTNRVVDLQDVLNAADTPTSTALAALITSSGDGLRGNGKNASDTLAALAPAMHHADDLVRILNQQNSQLNTLVDTAQPVASALASNNGQDLDQLVSSTTQTLGTVAGQQQDLRQALANLPGALTSARRTLSQLAGVAGPTTDSLASIRPTTDNLSDISSELMDFSEAADPALESLPPVLDRAKDLFEQARPVVGDLHRAGPSIRDITRSFRNLDATSLSHLNDALELAKGWSVATADYDSIAHYFKAYVGLTPADLGVMGLGPVPGAPRKAVPNLPMPAPPEVPFDQVGKQLEPQGPGDPRTARPTGSGNSATGLSPGQEHGMVGQLLGGQMMGGGN
jgi:phospholipid/cholesterol/gamma-HCH transport system substrate-binding protein